MNQEQKDLIVNILDKLAFDDESIWKDEAMVVLEEYWALGALYHTRLINFGVD